MSRFTRVLHEFLPIAASDRLFQQNPAKAASQNLFIVGQNHYATTVELFNVAPPEAYVKTPRSESRTTHRSGFIRITADKHTQEITVHELDYDPTFSINVPQKF